MSLGTSAETQLWSSSVVVLFCSSRCWSCAIRSVEVVGGLESSSRCLRFLVFLSPLKESGFTILSSLLAAVVSSDSLSRDCRRCECKVGRAFLAGPGLRDVRPQD